MNTAVAKGNALKGPGVVIVGGGFGGLKAAQILGKAGVLVTLVDKRNFTLFQPLLYQVATGLLPTGDIAVPLRTRLKGLPSVTVLQGAATAIDLAARTLTVARESEAPLTLPFTHLIAATGTKHHYFGKEQWREHAPGLKTLEHALTLRRKLFTAFERAEWCEDVDTRRALLRFIVVGAGPTGVELAGAIAELSRKTLPGEFRRIAPEQAEVLLLEAGAEVLPVYPTPLRAKALQHLQSLGVTVRCGTAVLGVDAGGVEVMSGGVSERLASHNVLWAAGVRASAFGTLLAQASGAPTDRSGRLVVGADARLPTHPNVFVIGDLAAMTDARGAVIPGLAQGAMQAGAAVAARLVSELKQTPAPKPFVYRNLGMMAVIGTHRAVGDLGWVKVSGWLAWWMWAFVHVMALVAPRQRVRVFITWAWRYVTRDVGDRLITGSPAVRHP